MNAKPEKDHLDDAFWDTGATRFSTKDGTMTMREAGRIFRLVPEPPAVAAINDYIVSAVTTGDSNFFTYFLHHYEPRLNRRVYRFMLTEGVYGYDPVRFLDYKLSAVLAMFECLQGYAPDKGADFLTYAHHFIGNALLDCRRHEEGGSFKSLDEYKAARGIAWLYNNSGKSASEVIADYASQQSCSEELASEYLTLARQNRNWVPFYSVMQDEDSEETGEDVSRDDSWNYASILWNGIRADAVQAAFGKLGYREQVLIEGRNAVCMTCGKVSPLSQRVSFEDLAIQFEGSSTSGAERAYRRALDKLTILLAEAGVIGAVELQKVSKNKKTAVYEYRAIHPFSQEDDAWGELHFDFVKGTAHITKLADGDTVQTNKYAKAALERVMDLPYGELTKKMLMAFEDDLPNSTPCRPLTNPLEAGTHGIVELRQIAINEKIATATYEYKAVHRFSSGDDEWGILRFDFANGTAEITKLADGDTSKTNKFGKAAIQKIRALPFKELPKETRIALEL